MAREGLVSAVFASHVTVRGDFSALPGEMAVLPASGGRERRGIVFRVEGSAADVRCFEGVAGVSVGDSVLFLGFSQTPVAEKFLLGGFYDSWGEPLFPSPPCDRTERRRNAGGALESESTPQAECSGASEGNLATGLRVLDALFPLSLGGRFAVAGASGTGKTTLLREVLRGVFDRRLSAAGKGIDAAVWAFCGARSLDLLNFTTRLPGAVLAGTATFVHTADRGLEEAELLLREAARTACAYRERGHDVLFCVDALPCDDLGRWARLCAINGVEGRGSVTVVTTLSSFDDENAARFDGLWALDPFMASWGCFPALDRRLSFARAAEGRLSFLSQGDRDFMLAALARGATSQRDGAEAPTDLQRWDALFAYLTEGVFLRQNAFEADDLSNAACMAALWRILRELDAMTRRFLEEGRSFSELAPFVTATQLADLKRASDATAVAERGGAWLAAFSEGLGALEQTCDTQRPEPDASSEQPASTPKGEGK